MIYLAGQIRQFANDGLSDPDIEDDFCYHIIKAFNSRWNEMASPEARLALFLHPQFRVIGMGPEWQGGKQVFTPEAAYTTIKQKVSFGCCNCILCQRP